MAAARRQFAVRAKLHNAADAGPTITVKTCEDLTTALSDDGADVLGCSLVAAVTGAPDGCECRLKAGSCPFDCSGSGGDGCLEGPPKDTLKLTGLSSGVPYTTPALGGVTLIPCMYWFWPAGSSDAAHVAEQKKKSVEAVKEMVEAANAAAEGNAANAAVGLWDATPTPFQTTAPPPTTTTVLTTTTAAPTTTTPEPTTTTTAAP